MTDLLGLTPKAVTLVLLVAGTIQPEAYLPMITALLVIASHFLARRKVREIHVLVNSQHKDAMRRIEQLEAKMGLKPGEAIPDAQVVTQPSGGIA
jgi:predicted dinucleotide-binding enzyme